MRLIIDCNIWISFLIGSQTQFISQVLSDSRFDIYVCDRLITKICDVASRSKIRKYIGDNDVEKLIHIIKEYCHFADINADVQTNIRDVNDLYLIQLADRINADYIVSGDADILHI